MITIFYRAADQIVSEIDEQLLETIPLDDILWVDLVNPSFEEKDQVETFFDINLQTREQVEEIESSSRYSETDRLIIANSIFLMHIGDSYVSEPTSFIIVNGVLVSHRMEELRSFGDTMRKLSYNPKAYPTGYHVLVALFETRIDFDADMLEGLAQRISALSTSISRGQEDRSDEEIIYHITSLQESTMQIRENIIDKQRVISGILKSERFPAELFPKLSMMIKDTNSLVNHADFGFDRLDFVQDAFMSLANIKLNRITKTFTVVSVVFMPPTLIASIYGMNFDIMPELHWDYGYVFAAAVMVCSSLITLIIFKIKKLL